MHARAAEGAAQARAPSRRGGRSPRRPTRRPRRTQAARTPASSKKRSGLARCAGRSAGAACRAGPPRPGGRARPSRERAAGRRRRSPRRERGVTKPASCGPVWTRAWRRVWLWKSKRPVAREGLDLLPGQERALAVLARAGRVAASRAPASTSSQVGAGGPGRDGMRPGTRKTTAFMPCRRSRGAATLQTEPRPSSKVSTTARSRRLGAARGGRRRTRRPRA